METATTGVGQVKMIKGRRHDDRDDLYLPASVAARHESASHAFRLAVIAVTTIVITVAMLSILATNKLAEDNRILYEQGLMCMIEQLAEHRVANDEAHDRLVETGKVADDGTNPPPVPKHLRENCDPFFRFIEHDGVPPPPEDQ